MLTNLPEVTQQRLDLSPSDWRVCSLFLTHLFTQVRNGWHLFMCLLIVYMWDSGACIQDVTNTRLALSSLSHPQPCFNSKQVFYILTKLCVPGHVCHSTFVPRSGYDLGELLPRPLYHMGSRFEGLSSHHQVCATTAFTHWIISMVHFHFDVLKTFPRLASYWTMTEGKHEILPTVLYRV